MLVETCGDWIRYSNSTDFLVYNGICWQESEQAAVGVMANFLDIQLKMAKLQIDDAKQKLVDSGIPSEIVEIGGRKLSGSLFGDSQRQLLKTYLDAKKFYDFIVKHRDNRYVISTLQQVKPYILIDVNQLDSAPFLLILISNKIAKSKEI